MRKTSGHKRHNGRKHNRQYVERKAAEEADISPFLVKDEARSNQDRQHNKPDKRRQTNEENKRSHSAARRSGFAVSSDEKPYETSLDRSYKDGGAFSNRSDLYTSSQSTWRKGSERSEQKIRSGKKDARSKSDRYRNGANRGRHNQQKLRGKDGAAAQSQPLRGLRDPVSHVPDVTYVEPRTASASQAGVLKTNAKREREARARAPYGRSGRRGEHRDAGKLYAALDLGTNNCRLLIALPQQRGRFRVIDGYSRIVRLGEGMASSGKLSHDAMERTIEALQACADKLISHNITRHRLIATEACRQAENGNDFIQRVRELTGMKLEVIDRETEAFLAAEGCSSLIDPKAQAAVLFDIGGGSSELILVKRGPGRQAIQEQIEGWISLPLGVVTLSEKYGGRTVTNLIFEQMVEEVCNLLEPFAHKHRCGGIWQKGRAHLLGTSGTVTTLAGLHLGLKRYERKSVDGLWLRSDDIDNVMKRLLKMGYEERAASPCIGRDRADLVMSGCAILEAIRRTWPCNRLRVADRGLREGVLTQLMTADNAWLSPKFGRKNRKSQR